MVQEIARSVAVNLQALIDEMRKLGIGLMSFVITFWLVLGALSMTFALPDYGTKMMAMLNGNREVPIHIDASKARLGMRNDVTPYFLSRPVIERNQARDSQKIKHGLRESSRLVSELKGLTRAIGAILNR